MSNPNDFVIENGVLKRYRGKNKDVTIPDNVKWIKGSGIGAFNYGVFAMNETLCSLTIPGDGIRIEKEAVFGCSNLSTVLITGNNVRIESEAFSGCTNLTNVTLMCSIADIDKNAFWAAAPQLAVFAPNLPFSVLKQAGLGMAAARSFVFRYQEFPDPGITAEYATYLSSQRKKLLPIVLENDCVEMMRLLVNAKKINEKNLEQEYLLPAMQSKAEKCMVFLKSLFGGTKTCPETTTTKKPILWDGVHFSADGKKLLKYPEEEGRTIYEVPEGTKEICKGAFILTPLEQIILPESVTTVRNEAFEAQDRKPLFIRFPRSIQKIPGGIFLSSYDYGVDFRNKYYYVSSPVNAIAEQVCMDSEFSGCGRIIYTGGPLDDLPPKTKMSAVLGMLYAEKHKLEDMSPWRDSYRQYLKSNQKTAVKWALEHEQLLQWMLSEGLFTETGAELLQKSAAELSRLDLTTAVLEYRNAHFSDKEKKDALSLSENDPQLKRLAKTEDRREQVKQQKGIRGITFVATGDLDQFGYVNEYTGGHDFSDLKAYIEARGGFLRSAVSAKTDYLICNDPKSQTAKSKKAAEIGVPVITEEEFLKMAEETK